MPDRARLMVDVYPRSSLASSVDVADHGGVLWKAKWKQVTATLGSPGNRTQQLRILVEILVEYKVFLGLPETHQPANPVPFLFLGFVRLFRLSTGFNRQFALLSVRTAYQPRETR